MRTMKKMLLVSMFQNVANILRTVEPDLKNKTVTYIPTASIVEKLGFFVKMEIEEVGFDCRRIGNLHFIL